ALLVITAGIQILLDNHSLLIVRKTLYFLTFHPKISLIFSQPISGQDRDGGEVVEIVEGWESWEKWEK
ncbi:MAG: hypothetical protein J5523_04960, partial [Muribaculaceae bacterium]|nr:hypothetical protein [Muribaculaceae bacterium]